MTRSRRPQIKRSIRISFASFLVVALLALASAPAAQFGTVDHHQKISETAGGFGGILPGSVGFGSAVAGIGDLDGDGNLDLAVGSPFDLNGGAVWILFLDADGTVASEQKISETTGFKGELDASDSFGAAVAALGDLDGNGTTDLAVGAPGDDDGDSDQGAVWLLFLNPDGTVDGQQKISATSGGIPLLADDHFGACVASPGDLDGDGEPDLVVGVPGSNDGGSEQGAIWILFLNSLGWITSMQEISETSGGFGGDLDIFDAFGSSVCSLGDLDGDGVTDLAVGEKGDNDGGQDQGAVWILFMNADGTVAGEQKISETTGGFGGVLDPFLAGQPGDAFGAYVAAPGDLDGDGVVDLTVGTRFDDDGGTNQGAVWVLFLNADGTVDSERKISETSGNFEGVLDSSDFFGPVTSPGDLDGDGNADLAVGAFGDDDGGPEQGAVWILFLDEKGAPRSQHYGGPPLPAVVFPTTIFLPSLAGPERPWRAPAHRRPTLTPRAR